MVTGSVPLADGREAACMIVEGGRTYCIDPLEETLQLISRRWALLVIGVLGNREQVRFGELKRTIPGLSARALSSILKELQEQRLTRRDVESEATPPAVHYGLTDRGRSLRQALIPLIVWAEGTAAPPSDPLNLTTGA